MSSQIGEFFAKLGFDVDDKKLKDFEKGMERLTPTFLGVAGGALAAASAIRDITAHSIESAQQMHNISEQTGEAEDSVRSLSYAMNKFNPSINITDYANSLQRVGENLNNIFTGRGDSSPFAKLGLAPRDYLNADKTINVLKLIQDLRKRAQEGRYDANKAYFTTQITEMGLMGQSIDTLKAKEVDFQKALQDGYQSQQVREANLQLGNSFNNLQQAMDNATADLVSKWAPGLEKLSEKIKEQPPAFLAFAGAANTLWPTLEKVGEALIFMKVFGIASMRALAAEALLLAARFAPLIAIYELWANRKEIGAYVDKSFKQHSDDLEKRKKGLPTSGDIDGENFHKRILSWFGISSSDSKTSPTTSDDQPAQPGALPTRLSNLLKGNLTPASAYAAPGGNSTNNSSAQTVNQNININIDSTEDTNTVARKTVEHLNAQQRRATNLQIGNGSVY